MIIYPAIDIQDGKCVRLKQGKAEDRTVFYDNPLDAANMWTKKGAKALHIVDLDGAFKGRPCNLDTIFKIKYASGIFVQMGGGIRDRETIETAIEGGIDRVILGTAALNDKDLVQWAAGRYGENIAVSIDALNKKVAYQGWTGISEIQTDSLIESLVSMGIKTFIYTDISRDGMMNGPDFEGIVELKKQFNINIIASGGITTIDDVKAFKSIDVYGAIIGRALYSGSINIEEALEVAACSSKG